jgi:hypothetical protein
VVKDVFVQLPKIYENELYYSIVSRYHQQSLNFNSTESLKEFGLLKTTPLLPNNLNFFLKEVFVYSPPSMDSFLKSHTLYFYYCNFVTHKEKEELFDFFVGKKKRVTIKMHERFWALHSTRYIRYCTQCSIENNLDGEDYWNLKHQIPSIFICPVHHIPLNNSNVQISERALKINQSTDSLGNIEPLMLKKKTIFHLKNLNNESLKLYKRDYKLYQLLKPKLYFVLISKGFGKDSGEINILKLESVFINYFGIELLNFVGFNHEIFKEIEINPFLFHIELKPIEALLLILFLSGSIEHFLQLDYSFQFNHENPLRCKNPYCSTSNQTDIQIVNLKILKGKVLVSYECPDCNFLFDSYFESKQWNPLLIKIKDCYALNSKINSCVYIEKMDIENLSNKFNISSIYIEKSLLMKTDYSSVSDSILSKKRKEWKDLTSSNPEKSIIDLKNINFPLYSFLYRNDKEWFEHEIYKVKKTSKKDQIGTLEKRDKKILFYLKDKVREQILCCNFLAFPWIYREVELLDIHYELSFLKLTSKYIEMHRQFYLRIHSNSVDKQNFHSEIKI